MVINVLATDMKFHFDKLDKWEQIMIKYGERINTDFGSFFLLFIIFLNYNIINFFILYNFNCLFI